MFEEKGKCHGLNAKRLHLRKVHQLSFRLVLPTCTNAYQQLFNETGLFYFQTESEKINQKHICVVEVIASHRLFNLSLSIETAI
jgi:hypothetical protein